MQPNQGRAPGSPMPLPPGATQSLDKFLERWWVVVPGRLRQYSVYLSVAWADGIYLTAWPIVAALAPVVLLLFGLLEGATHWSLLINDSITFPGEVAITFTQLLPFMVLTAAVSALHPAVTSRPSVTLSAGRRREVSDWRSPMDCACLRIEKLNG